MSLELFIHGLVMGLCLAQEIILATAAEKPLEMALLSLKNLTYNLLLFVMFVLCLVSILDRYDIAHLDVHHAIDLIRQKKFFTVVVLYSVCLVTVLLSAVLDDTFIQAARTEKLEDITEKDIWKFKKLVIIRALLAFLAWIIVALFPMDDLLLAHLEHMRNYIR